MALTYQRVINRQALIIQDREAIEVPNDVNCPKNRKISFLAREDMNFTRNTVEEIKSIEIINFDFWSIFLTQNKVVSNWSIFTI